MSEYTRKEATALLKAAGWTIDFDLMWRHRNHGPAGRQYTQAQALALAAIDKAREEAAAESLAADRGQSFDPAKPPRDEKERKLREMLLGQARRALAAADNAEEKE